MRKMKSDEWIWVSLWNGLDLNSQTKELPM
jgi:hypothetical protein